MRIALFTFVGTMIFAIIYAFYLCLGIDIILISALSALIIKGIWKKV